LRCLTVIGMVNGWPWGYRGIRRVLPSGSFLL
jgi:hypothetical protein